MDTRLIELAEKAELTLFDYQQEYLEAVLTQPDPLRACLYYKTGAGKSFTSLASVALKGYPSCVVVCPPSTHGQWLALGEKLGVAVAPMSHAKFRMKDTRLSRHKPIIADEMHLFGGQRGKGWRKLDRIAQHLQAPLILMSATPNYNDAERCYCIQHILDPHSCSGGYLQFIYQNCLTEQNPFGMEPKVIGFQKHRDAAEFLAAMPKVWYLPDDLVIDIQDLSYDPRLPSEMTRFNYNRRRNRMIASIIEHTHAARYQGLVSETGLIHPHVMDEVMKVLLNRTPVMVYANHATIATAIERSLRQTGYSTLLVTGETPKPTKLNAIYSFLSGTHDVLIGTATLATGTDGLDRVCDTLLIVDDTDDNSLRRQLIGRIMPRGDFVSVVDKQVFRLVPLST